MSRRQLSYVLILACVGIASAEEDRISLDAYLEQVQQDHPFFRAEALSGDIALKEQARLAGAEDWVVSATPSYTYDDRIDPTFGAPDVVKNVRGEAGVGRTFWETGGRLDLGYTYDHDELTFVIQSRDQEAVAQLLYARNAAEYHVLWLQYRALTDELLPTSP